MPSSHVIPSPSLSFVLSFFWLYLTVSDHCHYVASCSVACLSLFAVFSLLPSTELSFRLFFFFFSSFHTTFCSSAFVFSSLLLLLLFSSSADAVAHPVVYPTRDNTSRLSSPPERFCCVALFVPLHFPLSLPTPLLSPLCLCLLRPRVGTLGSGVEEGGRGGNTMRAIRGGEKRMSMLQRWGGPSW